MDAGERFEFSPAPVVRYDHFAEGDQEFAGGAGWRIEQRERSGPAGMMSDRWLVDRGGAHGRHDDGRGSSNPSSIVSSSKKSEKSLEADEAPGQEVAGRSGADNPCSEGS